MNDKSKKPKIIVHLENVAPFIPFPLYWGDVDTLKVLGANQSCLDAMGASCPEDVIGKTPYDYYPKEIADVIIQHIKKIVELKVPLSQEDPIQDITTGKIRYYNAIRAPLFDDENNVVAIIGTSIEITAEKEAERLQILHEQHVSEKELDKLLKKSINDVSNILSNLKFEYLRVTNKQKLVSLNSMDKAIKLTEREQEILYYLNDNKSPKEIATIIGNREKKNLAPATVLSIICKQLYIKFDVGSTGAMLDKARLLNLIPLLPHPFDYE